MRELREHRAFVRAVGAIALVVTASVNAQQPAPQTTPPAGADIFTSIPQVRFNSGQSVVPYYEGWLKNADGSFDMVFGYFNRNWQQELAIPAGPNNKVEPGAGDQGQPTFFLPRRQRWMFRLRVPANFGTKELTWTLIANGKTERVVGSLIASEEINERVIATNGGFDPGDGDPNQPPSVATESYVTASSAAPVTLAVTVTDDGLPKPKTPAPSRPAAPPPPGQPNFVAQVNSSGATRPRGPTLTWLQYGGPAKAVFEPAGATPVTLGQSQRVSIRFTTPGLYRFVAVASDTAMVTRQAVTVTVEP